MRSGLKLFTTVAALLLATASAQAGQRCDAVRPSPQDVRRGLDLALRAAHALEASGGQVAIIGRAGQDLSAHRLRYSHIGIAYREVQPDGVARWLVVHKLNHCGSSMAGVHRQGLGEFFMDQPHRYEARIAVLDPALQAGLRPWVQDSFKLGRMHEPSYNMLAYPWSTRYQQSNQWVLEVLASATDPLVYNRAQAQVWLRQQGYRPTTVHIPAMKRLGAQVTSGNIAFDDHPTHLRFSGRIETVTADSVFDWLSRAYPKTQHIELREEGTR